MTRVLLILVLFVALIGCVLLALWVVADISWKRAGHEQWPAGLGTLDQVERRYPAHEDSKAALRLADLALPLGIALSDSDDEVEPPADVVTAYVDAQYENPGLAIDAPPADTVKYLAQHESELDAVRDHLAMPGAVIEWHVDMQHMVGGPTPEYFAHLRLARALVARALIRARDGDPRAWDDLHAVAALRGAFSPRPELVSQHWALTLTKLMNGTAWKLPLPVPQWWSEEMSRTDHRAAMLAGFRNDTWWYWSKSPHFLGSNYAEHQRETARQLAAVTACAFDGDAFLKRRNVDLPLWNPLGSFARADPSWRRVIRLTAEREATANALRVRSGQPILEHSQCSDGAWHYENGTLAFSIDIPPGGKRKAMPLKLIVAQ